ncbi:cytochrome P450 [Streptomyces sp. N2A]|uniref:cytochrome P450 n=1 Tax=Streptomyces sp. N2A TaxID=3073936 RepID=UPI00286FC7A7|nr:cytochrome P450 [Streptomyces sp. N2A]
MTTVADRWNIRPDHTWLRGQRPEHNVRFDEDGSIDIYGYPEAAKALTNPQIFSNDVGRLFLDEGVELDERVQEGSLLQSDPPAHGKLRKLVSRAFTPKTVADLEPRIAALTRELLDQAGSQGKLELVAALTYPLPVIVICELLGVPASDRDLFKKWVDRMAQSASALLDDEADGEDVDVAAANRYVPEMHEYLAAQVAERRRQPKDDLLTSLVQAEVDGDRLTDAQVLNFANELLVVGHATTSALLGNLVLCLDAYPEAAARVRADRSLVPGAVEESLRFLSPVAAIYRATAKEFELDGHHVDADRLVRVWVGAANRDPRQFTDPDTFDPARDPNPHIGFSHGIHFCLGAPLARLESTIALNMLLDRYPALSIDPAEPPTFMSLPDAIGVATLPLRTG